MTQYVVRKLKRELWPHMVKLDIQDSKQHNITEMELWLGATLGTFRGRWNVVYNYNSTDFYFKNEHDATLFALRWS
jgi:hypothetical protein